MTESIQIYPSTFVWKVLIMPESNLSNAKCNQISKNRFYLVSQTHPTRPQRKAIHIKLSSITMIFERLIMIID
ncbi:hypothetical protein EUTSA_v10021878mg [Eutrema salsugineum]|uniref:Uncharacterized protein n=1 Tax=Eutrema salsugineum TaxID=72664 RepID=V4M253_EUTSA|nr:hypothetical protein EUTSA_v10021878mg [Eutrema salsugineum]